jgi:hypothetical protein
MEDTLLHDKNVFPTDTIIFKILGKNKSHWIELFDFIRSQYPDIEANWRYYNDGKSWLLKVTRKEKTVFWLSLIDATFRTTFYFNIKHDNLVLTSPISDDLKEQYKKNKKFNKIKPITVYVRYKKNIENIKKLIEMKLQVI